MKIVTGYRGVEHITSNDDQARNQGIFGTGNSILNIGNLFALTIVSATSVTIADGEGMLQGVHFRIEPGQTEQVDLSPGTPGYNRVDLICARYTKDAVTGVEDVSLVVIEGDPTDGTPTEPTYNTTGDILTGATVVDYPLHKVTFTGVTPTSEALNRVLGKLYTVELTFNGTGSIPNRIVLEPGVYYFSGMISFGGGEFLTDSNKYFNCEITCHDGSYGGYNRITTRAYADVNRGQIHINGLLPVGIETDTAEGTASRNAVVEVFTNAISGSYGATAYLRMMRIR